MRRSASLFPDCCDPVLRFRVVATFLKDHGIDYIYADPRYPNSLVTNAVHDREERAV